MKFSFLSPLLFTLGALFLSALESSLFPHLGIPAYFIPDLNLALIVFLSSRSLGGKVLLSAAGIALCASLFGSPPGIGQPLSYLFMFFAGYGLNQTIFLNNLFPQALFTGLAKGIMTVLSCLNGAAPPTPGLFLLQTTGASLSTAFFALPLLFFLLSMTERCQPDGGNQLSV
ncbi:MAG: hypothetical protein JXR89_01210 [Deltaproteobacteria bacterium]|nr:hypothetical protein [Deltaproteobacteria bacterium]